MGHKEQSIQRSCGRRTRIKTRPVCDCRVDREEGKGDNEAGGQIMPDLVGQVKDFGFFLKSDVNLFKCFIQSWWIGVVWR